MTREGRRVEDPDSGRYIINYAYSLGCLKAIGDADAMTRFRNWIDAANKPSQRKAKMALIEQFRMGQRHESERGAP